MFTKFFNVFLVTILLCATQAAPSEAAGAEASEVAITEDSFKRFAPPVRSWVKELDSEWNSRRQ